MFEDSCANIALSNDLTLFLDNLTLAAFVTEMPYPGMLTVPAAY